MRFCALLISAILVAGCTMTGCTAVNSDADRDFHETARLWMQPRQTKTITVERR
jgi:hypothetical protein